MKKITRKDFLRGSAAGAFTMALGMIPGTAYAEETAAGDIVASGEKYTATLTADGWIKVVNEDGATLGYSADSGVTLIEVDGYAFKDLNGNGELDDYEDWRLDPETRAENLVSLMDVQDELPLMLLGLYDFSYVAGEIDTITERLDAGLRASCTPFSLIATDTWSQYINKAQAYVEAQDAYGIPVEFCAEISAVTTLTSNWAHALSLAATMSTDFAFESGKQLSLEMRALGISGAMAPQADVATDPRWARFLQTLGEDPQLTSDMISSFLNGFQSTFDEDGNDLGWGTDSVLTQIKHFPGEGSDEGGRDSHDSYGKYLIYPTEGSMDTLLTPFRNAMSLSGATGQVSGVMPCYSVLIGSDGNPLDDEEVGGGFSDYLLQDVLRDELGFEGVISSDFEIVTDLEDGGKCYGVEDLSVPERYLKAIIAGVDRFGGQSDPTDILEAYQLGVEEYGEDYMKERIDESVYRLMLNYFRIGLFDNAYVSEEYINEVVNTEEASAAGYESIAGYYHDKERREPDSGIYIGR
ncbi:MAG: hypothetical protein LUF27_07665 [Lachnospiraceae bacterium]|nr:hypothetical protein [Lachnospiraceae bacterium]